MKNNKKFCRIACAFTILNLCLCLCGCSDSSEDESSQSSKANQKSLYAQGLEVVALLDETAKSEEYSKLMSSADEIAEIGAEIAKGDYSKPGAVYEVKFNTEDFIKAYANADGNFDQLSDALKESLKMKIGNSFTNILNAQKGVNYVAASAIYNAGKTFVNDSLEENTAYLYTYTDAYPVFVTFSKGEDSAVSANGSFLFDDEFDGESEQTVENYLEEEVMLDFSVTAVETE